MHASAFSFRSLSLTLMVLVGLSFSGCAVPFGSEQAAAQTQVALNQYVDAVRQMNADAVASMVAPDGQLINPGQPVVVGPAGAKQYIDGFKGYRVISYTTNVDNATLVQGHVIQNGTYDQQVQVPQGNVVTSHGNFRMDWVQGPDGRWMIFKAVTWQ